MKNIFTTLKSLRAIESSPEYHAHSRSVILNTSPKVSRPRIVWGWFLENLEVGASVALAGLCIFLLFAGFSVWRSFSPLSISRLDLAGLRAEAQAIDIQIKLAGLRYEESALPIITPVSSVETTIAEVIPFQSATVSSQTPDSSSVISSSTSDDTTSTAPLTLDEALRQLSE
ncbi:MAG: hypothetical protein NUV53_00980 [Patescibacteria group bacterium]|nr:hypothetical protein [Patescibacteria group bacterium]